MAPAWLHDVDGFDRPDAEDLGSTEEQSLAWQVDDGGDVNAPVLGVLDGGAVSYSFSSAGYATVDEGWADGTVAAHGVELEGLPEPVFELLFRYVDTDNWHSLLVSSGDVILGRAIGGIGATLTSWSDPAALFTDVYAVRGVGDQLEILKNGAVVAGPVTSTAFLTATRHGFYLHSLSDRLDDWEWTAHVAEALPGSARYPLRQRRDVLAVRRGL